LIFDRGPQFNAEVTETLKSFGIGPMRTSFRSPWQNGIAERWVGTCRRDLLDHVIVLNERHLKRLMIALGKARKRGTDDKSAKPLDSA
jgi:transposase InsO family protein